jgi:hypothetical protein
MQFIVHTHEIIIQEKHDFWHEIIIIIIIYVTEMGHVLTRSGLTCPEASSKVRHDSFCQSVSSVSLP